MKGNTKLLGLSFWLVAVFSSDWSMARAPTRSRVSVTKAARQAQEYLSKRTQRTVTVYAFRQTENNKAKDSFLYANTGHVGFSFNKGKTIYGFNPQIRNLDRSRWSGQIEGFKTGEVTRGILTNDTAVFEQARSFAVPVKEFSVTIGMAKYLTIRLNVLVDRLLGKQTWKRYAFPPPFGPGGTRRRTYNCAAYLRSVGMGDKSPFGHGGRLLDNMGGPELPVGVPPPDSR